tara:strand:+ start:3079 stop:3534 length:456 start_codon:yes stop_codon:yes gene_type:complete
MNRFNGASRKHQAGIGLIEVLVSLFLFSMGLLGVAGMQTVGLKNNQSSLERSQAVMYTYSILDAIRSDMAGFEAGQYQLDFPGSGCAAPTGASLAEKNLAYWLASIQQTMGEDACGSVQCGAEVCTVRIRWDDSRGSGGDTEQLVETRGRP